MHIACKVLLLATFSSYLYNLDWAGGAMPHLLLLTKRIPVSKAIRYINLLYVTFNLFWLDQHFLFFYLDLMAF